MHVWKWFWWDGFWNWLSDEIGISFTNVDVIFDCLQSFKEQTKA